MNAAADNGPPRAARRAPERTCAGCGKKGPPVEMLRLVVDPDGAAAPDVAGSSFGRGVHVHPTQPCLDRAARGGVARSVKGKVSLDVGPLADVVHEAALRRAWSLLVGASRARLVKWGARAVEEALAGPPGEGPDAGARRGALLVVASDAARPDATPAFSRAIAEGRAVVLGTKAELGALFRQEEVAFCAVLDHKVSREVHRMCDLAVVSRTWSGSSISRSKEAACRRSPEGR